MFRLFRLVKDVLRGKPAVKRSPAWRKLEKEHLAKEPVCQWCGGRKSLQVHHIVPFHLKPIRELDPSNLITLCEAIGLNCHLQHGHNDDWRKVNPDVVADCNRHRAFFTFRKRSK